MTAEIFRTTSIHYVMPKERQPMTTTGGNPSRKKSIRKPKTRQAIDHRLVCGKPVLSKYLQFVGNCVARVNVDWRVDLKLERKTQTLLQRYWHLPLESLSLHCHCLVNWSHNNASKNQRLPGLCSTPHSWPSLITCAYPIQLNREGTR